MSVINKCTCEFVYHDSSVALGIPQVLTIMRHSMCELLTTVTPWQTASPINCLYLFHQVSVRHKQAILILQPEYHG